MNQTNLSIKSLCPLLFLIFINDLDGDAAAAEIVMKFADNTKVAQSIRSERDNEELQSALTGLERWASKWGMAFKVQKCKVMHVGHANPRHVYSMGGINLEETVEERDLGVIMSNKLKPSAQCAKAARMARAVLGQITRAFHYKDKQVFVKLYKQYVRPHLEFAVQAWSPWSVADIEVIEKVQKKMIKMVSGLRSQDYDDRLLELGLTTLEERRHQADMAAVYKELKHGNELGLFTMAADAARQTRVAADPLNVRIVHGRLDVRKNFFSVRTTVQWNNVPSEMKKLPTVDSFKKAYAAHRMASV